MTETQKILIKLKQKLVGCQLSFADLSRHSGITEAAISKGFNGKTLAMRQETLKLLKRKTDELTQQKKE